MEFLYIFGEPGAGKSTLVQALTADLEKRLSREPVPHIVWHTPTAQVLEIGYERETFRGTDATPMSIQPAAIKYVHSKPCDFMLAEGDRLATDGFFQAIQEAGYKLTLLHVAPPNVVGRRAARALELGHAQNATWVAGRVTKVKNLVKRWSLDTNYVRLGGEELEEAVAAARKASKVAAILSRGNGQRAT